MKKIKKKKKEKFDWQSRVFDSLSFPTLMLDRDFDIISANRVFYDTWKIDAEDLENKKCYQLLFGFSVPCSSQKCPLTRVFSGKKGYSILNSTVGEDGSERWEERFFSPILDEEGEVIYIMESFRDTTRLKTLEKSLSSTKELMENILQSSPSAIIAADCNGKVLFFNKAAEKLFGYTKANVEIDFNFEKFFPSGTAEETIRNLRDHSGPGKTIHERQRLMIVDSSGEEIPVQFSAAMIHDEGRELATMCILDDLREKIEVERKLRMTEIQLMQSEKMASLGQLAAGVAHEINNPLTGILLYAKIIFEKLSENSPFREDLGYIIEDVNRCKEIVKNLLVYSRKTDSSKTICHLNDIVQLGLHLIRNQELLHDINLIKELSDEMMLIFGDRNQLSQVVINLLMNAIDSIQEKGDLTIRTYRDKAKGKVFFEISDSGHGIPKENLYKIFDPFFTTKPPGRGTGLGLSTVYGIIDEHGGKISVKETGPHGTTFQVELPLYHDQDFFT